MINLIYEKGEFRFEKAFESVTPQTMDVFLTVKDVVPDTQQPDLTQQACLFINKKLGTEYSTEGLGDFSKTEENHVCSSLRSVTFEKGSQLKYMVEGVFCDCEALTSIEIPASVEMIDMYYCINLANIYCYPSIPPILNDFRCKNFVLYVPSQSLEAYKNSSWSEYYSSIKTIQ